MDQIIALLEERISRTHVFAALDTLEFLRRSGRMNWALAGLGSLLQIKPVLKMYNGSPTSERVRTSNGATRRLIELVSDLGPLEQLALVHTYASHRVEVLRQQAQHLFPSSEAPLSVEVTPVIGAHIGPGAVGFACVTAREE
jgi:DegV family protein with EDD domain